MDYEVHVLKMQWSIFRNLTYLIVDKATRKAAVVDPAWELEKIVDKLQVLGARLSAVLLTHSHMDHVNLVPELARVFGPDVFMNGREIDEYDYRAPGLRAMKELDTIHLGATRFFCLDTPGHTAGGMCYLLPDSLFTGDTIFTEGCGICHAKGGCPGAMYHSLQRVKRTVDRDVRIFPGHSFGQEPGQTLGNVIRNNIYFQIEDESKFVGFRMRNAGADPMFHMAFK